MSDLLKLIAMDSEGLTLLSAHCQDAVFKVADMQYLSSENRFILVCKRLARGKKGIFRKPVAERRHTVLQFERVLNVQTSNVSMTNKDGVVNLLSIAFKEQDSPGGHIDLILSGGGVVRLKAECIEVQLSDLGSAWKTRALPNHEASQE